MEDFFPEILWIQNSELRNKVQTVFKDAMQQGGWEWKDLDMYTFSCNVPDRAVSLSVTLRDHIRAVTRMAHAIYKEYNAFYAGKYDLNYDYIIAGALLHDVGKFIELIKDDDSECFPRRVKYSYKKKFLNHAFIGSALALKHDIPYEVAHIIGYHSKEGDLWSKSPEAQIIKLIDHINFSTLSSLVATE